MAPPSPARRPAHARPAGIISCAVCGGSHPAERELHRPWTRGELLMAGWCAGVATLAGAELLARWLFA
jgi:hypothetical protein